MALVSCSEDKKDPVTPTANAFNDASALNIATALNGQASFGANTSWQQAQTTYNANEGKVAIARALQLAIGLTVTSSNITNVIVSTDSIEINTNLELVATTTPISVTVGDTSGINFVATTTNITLTKTNLFSNVIITSTLTATTLGNLGTEIETAITPNLYSINTFNELFTNSTTGQQNVTDFASHLGGIEADKIESITTDGTSITIAPKEGYTFALTGTYSVTGAIDSSTNGLKISGLAATTFIPNDVTPLENPASGFNQTNATNIFDAGSKCNSSSLVSTPTSGNAATVTYENNIVTVTSDSSSNSWFSIKLPKLVSTNTNDIKALVGEQGSAINSGNITWDFVEGTNADVKQVSNEYYLMTTSSIGSANATSTVKISYKISVDSTVKYAGFLTFKLVVHS